MAVLALYSLLVVRTFLPFVIGSFNRCTVEWVRNVMADRAEFRLGVKIRILGLVVRGGGIRSRAKFYMFLFVGRKNVRTVVITANSRNVMAYFTINAW